MEACPIVVENVQTIAGAPSYEDYFRTAAVPRRGGGWRVEGDLYAANEEEVRRIYYRNFAIPSDDGKEFRSTVGCSQDGIDRVNNPHRKLNMTYCIGHFDDLGLKALVVDSMDRMSREWERAADVNFILVNKDEDDCIPTDFDEPGENGDAYFRVAEGDQEADDNENTNGSGFFPGSAAGLRTLFIFPRVLDADTPADQVDHTVLHELGHTLGLVHEFTRFVQGGIGGPSDCSDSVLSAWRARSGLQGTSSGRWA